MRPSRSTSAPQRHNCYDAPVSGEPHIRKVRPDDLEEVWRVHVASSNDLAARRGRPTARPADAPVASDARAGLASDPDGYFCAVEEGRIYGMVSALVHGRADDQAYWRSDASAVVAIERGGELTAFAYRRGERIGPAAGRDETALVQAVAAAANAGGGGKVTVRVPGACASLLEALVGCGFRIGELAVFLASRPFGRPELYLPSGPILY